MDKQNEVLVLTQKESQKPTFKQAVKYGVATAVVAGAMTSANAAEITAIGEGLTGEIDAGKALIITLFTAGAILLGIFAGWRYLKRGANSA